MEHNERIIDPEWADTLLGLRMSVPNHWWKDHRGNKLHQGSIVLFHENTNRWHLVLDDVNDDNQYPMSYKGVVEYVDAEAGTYANYNLPPEQIYLPADRLSWQTKTYYRTNPKDWTRINDNGDNARTVEPVPYTDGDEEFKVNITPAEVESLKDSSGDIRFSKVMEFCLPRFDDPEAEGGKISLWEFQAARMRNYMSFLIYHHGYKPKYYDPLGDKPKNICKFITADHVARFYGVMMARIWSNNTSIDKMWSVRETLDAVPSVKEALPQDAYKDLYRCMHFIDDWEADTDSEWEEYFNDTKVEVDGETAAHALV